MDMNTDKIDEFIKSYVEEVKKLHTCADRFADANKKLEGWDSPAKRQLEEKLNSSVPKFDELVEVVLSYAKFARFANNEASSNEREIVNFLG